MSTIPQDEKQSAANAQANAKSHDVKDIQSKAVVPAAPSIRLTPSNGSDQPVLVNCVNLEMTSGTVFLDFGFIDPAVVSAMHGSVQAGGRFPEQVDGRLAVRVAFGVDLVPGLHQQLGSMVTGMAKVLDQQIETYVKLKEAPVEPAKP